MCNWYTWRLKWQGHNRKARRGAQSHAKLCFACIVLSLRVLCGYKEFFQLKIVHFNF